MALKIETSNPATSHVLSGKENLDALKASLFPKETVGTAHPTDDNITISIPFPSTDKNLSALLSNLIKLLNLSDEVVGAGLKSAPTADTNANDLIKVMESLFYKGEEPLTFLKEFIENSGLQYEAKIAKGDIKGLEGDLKGLLLKLVERSEKVGAGFKPAPVLNALLNDIEARQILNARGKDEGVFFLHIPVLLPQGASTAEVQVRRDGKGKGEYSEGSHRIGFSIETRGAGVVSFDVSVNKKGRDVTCYVSTKAENAEFLEFMNAHLPELTERLSGYGIRVEVK